MPVQIGGEGDTVAFLKKSSAKNFRLTRFGFTTVDALIWFSQLQGGLDGVRFEAVENSLRVQLRIVL